MSRYTYNLASSLSRSNFKPINSDNKVFTHPNGSTITVETKNTYTIVGRVRAEPISPTISQEFTCNPHIDHETLLDFASKTNRLFPNPQQKTKD